MLVIQARNVNNAYLEGLGRLIECGDRESSRAGEVLVFPTPVTVVYNRPMERVLFDERRDANPFFHLFEALWMLAGRSDATWLDFFVKDFSERFAEAGGLLHGAYGHRWRHAFGFDQLEAVVGKLQDNPGDRQAVIQMWDATHPWWGQRGCNDLLGDWKDRPCNTHAYLRIREEQGYSESGEPVWGFKTLVLDMTVCCRSNDAIWGAFGANVVHFSVLLEYLAARLGVAVGRYYQVANNFHVYTDVLKRVSPPRFADFYTAPEPIRHSPIVTAPESFDRELLRFLDGDIDREVIPLNYANEFLPATAWPLYRAYLCWRVHDFTKARRMLSIIPIGSDWRLAAEQWLERRVARREAQGVQNGR